MAEDVFGAAKDGSTKVFIVKVLILPIAIWFLEWLLPLLVQVLVAGPLHHPPLLTSQNMTSTTKSWVDQ